LNINKLYLICLRNNAAISFIIIFMVIEIIYRLIFYLLFYDVIFKLHKERNGFLHPFSGTILYFIISFVAIVRLIKIHKYRILQEFLYITN
jgi:hypothetical protein